MRGIIVGAIVALLVFQIINTFVIEYKIDVIISILLDDEE